MPRRSTKPPARKQPKIALHRATGQAYVRLDGHMHYLGKYGEPAAHERGHRLIAEHLACGGRLPAKPEEVTVAELVAQYLEYCRGYYGDPSKRRLIVLDAVQPLLRLYGSLKASEIGPLALIATRQQWIDSGLCRSTINDRAGILKRMFRWGGERGLVPGGVYHNLACIEGLRKGRSAAKEPRRIGPVADAHVDAIRPYVSRQVWGLIELQRYSGARSSELLRLRRCDLDTSGKVWVCRLQEHKTAIHGKPRVLCFGDRAQAILREFFPGKGPADYLFSPKDAEAERHARMHEARKTPLSCGNVPGSNRKARPEVAPGDCYDAASYRRAIARGVEQANRDRHREGLPAIPDWHPHQLRHNFATKVRRQFGLEGAQVALGHSNAKTSEIYAELDTNRAINIAAAIG